MKWVIKMYRIDKKVFDKFWNYGVIIFDTNSLLSMYEFSHDACIELMDVLSYKLENIWIPSQVKNEYNKLNKRVRNSQYRKYSDIPLNINKIIDDTTAQFESLIKQVERNKFEDTINKKLKEYLNYVSDLSNEVKNFKYNDIDNLSEETKSFLNSNTIENFIVKVFHNVGRDYSEKELQTIYSEGKQRFAQRIPPGFEDGEKIINGYGDLVIWKQILEKATEMDKPILFVTLDEKKDWWELESNNEIKSPHPKLIEEYNSISKQKHNFSIVTLHDFISNASRYVNTDVEALMNELDYRQMAVSAIEAIFYGDLLNSVNDYFSDNNGKLSEVLGNDYDFTDVPDISDVNIINIDAIVEEDEIFYEGQMDLYTNVAFKVHWDREDHDVGDRDITLRANFSFSQAIEFSSQYSERRALSKGIEDLSIDIESFEIVDYEEDDNSEEYYGDYEPDCDDYEPDPDDYYDDSEPDPEDYYDDYESDLEEYE
jgi:rRNA-processing protein FCF1